MDRKFLHTLNLLTAFVLIFGLTVSNAPVTADPTPPAPLEIIARAKGLSTQDLVLDDFTTFTLLDGRQVMRIKAHDVKSGLNYGGDFENGVEVDLAALEKAAGQTWRAQYGALTKDTVKALAGRSPNDTVNISLWLAGDIQALPREADNPEERPITSNTSGEFSAVPSTQISKPPITHLNGKDFIIPLSSDQIPLEVLNSAVPVDYNTIQPEKTAEELAMNMAKQANDLPAADLDGKIEAFKQANQRYLQAQVAPLQSALAERLGNVGLKIAYSDPLAPTAYLENVPVTLVQEIAFWPEIDAIYIVPNQAGPDLETARPAQNADLANIWGPYRGTGVNVAVAEGERAFFANPGLILSGAYDSSQPSADHPTAVCGFIKSNLIGYEGLANGSSVYSANGSYSNWSTMKAALTYATTNATVINNSWYWDSSNSAVFWEADRLLDYYVRYNYDFVSVAAGNFGNGCGSNFSSYVVSPAKGYNVLSVGNYEDVDNINWSDDYMDACSSFGNPANDVNGATHEKPEVAAIGSSLDSTYPTTSEPYVRAVGSGTSYSSPMVASLAADLIQAKPSLADEPEVLRALIMATALHNVESDARLSDKDGVGGVDFTAALVSVERDNFHDISIDASTIFPMTFSQYAYKGERVRYVITWLSNPAGDYTSDPLPVDLDLYAYRSDGTTLIAGSNSSTNNYEIVDFIAPAAETYTFKIERWGNYTGNNTWLGSAWWRGEYRIPPNTNYSDPKATPLGTHLDILPSEWIHPNYWRVLAIRPTNSDHDLTLYSASIFDDPSARAWLAGSSSGIYNDLIVVDGNHKPVYEMDHYRINHFNGTGGYSINWSNNSGVVMPGLFGPLKRESAPPAEIYDLYLPPGSWYISVIPTATNTVDLAAYLYASDNSTRATWTKGLYGYSAVSNVSTSTLATETLTFNAPGYDYYGLVISALTAGVSQYYIKVESRIFLPSILR